MKGYRRFFLDVLGGAIALTLAGRVLAATILPSTPAATLAGANTHADVEFVTRSVSLQKGSEEVEPSASDPTPTEATYVSVTPARNKVLRPPPGGFTLIICLHGAGGNPTEFAECWVPLVRSRQDVVIASASTNKISSKMLAAIIADAVARDHVNPKHIILAGYSLGGEVGSDLILDNPGLFAGFAAISADPGFFNQKMRQNADKFALYESFGRQEDGISLHDVPLRVARYTALLKNYGFTHVLVEMPDRSHLIPGDMFVDMTKSMMTFFAKSLADFDQQAAALAVNPPGPVRETHPDVMELKRTLDFSNQISGSSSSGQGSPKRESYIYLTPDLNKFPTQQHTILLICLHGSNETAEECANRWKGLLDLYKDVVIAVPEINVSEGLGSIRHKYAPGEPLPDEVIAAISQDTAVRDGINPKHVYLVGQAEGGLAGAAVLGEHPNLVAGFAGLAVTHPFEPTPVLKKYASNLAVFWAVGSSDELFNDAKVDYEYESEQLKSFGFGNIHAERPDCGYTIPPAIFAHLAVNMMDFFEKTTVENDRIAAVSPAAAKPVPEDVLPAHLVFETRTVALPTITSATENEVNNPRPSRGSYVFVAQDSPKPAPVDGYTLLVCLHGQGDNAAEFAKQWISLVNSRNDLVVAAPEFDLGIFYNTRGVRVEDLVAKIIGETVAHDHVNPRHTILVWQGKGSDAGQVMVLNHPGEFAGIANIASEFSLSSALVDGSAPKKIVEQLKAQAAKTAVFDCIGTDQQSTPQFDADFATLKNIGFNVVADRPACGEYIPPEEFAKITERMMIFFDGVLRANDGLAEERTVDMPNQDPKLVAAGLGPQPKGAYMLLAPNRSNPPPVGGYTLLICLRGDNDSKENFTKQWVNFLYTHPDVVVATPEFNAPITSNHPFKSPSDLPNGRRQWQVDLAGAIIADLAAHDHVNPQHVILYGQADFAWNGALLLSDSPNLFAGFASIASGNAVAPSPALKSQADKIAVFWAQGTDDQQYTKMYDHYLAELENFGFGSVQADHFDGGHDITPDKFADITNQMMFFFNKAMKAQGASNGTGPLAEK